MTLDDIAARLERTDEPRVPQWALGTVHRRSITFATGIEDTQTFVVWVQAHGMTGDLRINPARPQLAPGTRLSDLDHQTLIRLATVEGGTATTSLRSDGLMAWNDWIGFQPYDKYPEPGIMRRIGDCMIEFAPSGIYVEDWRFQKSAPGLLAGLRLVAETDHAGNALPRAGGLVIAGDHAILSLARRNELPDGTRAQDYVRESSDPAAALARIFDCTVDYAVKTATTFTIKASTDPRREGTLLPLNSSFEFGSTPGTLIQHLEGGEIRSRLWQIDSLTPNVEFPPATHAGDAELAWLAREADTLLDPLCPEEGNRAQCA